MTHVRISDNNSIDIGTDNCLEQCPAESQGQPVISTLHLEVGYDGKTLIPDINIEVHKGEILALIGPNGAGKSTLLKTIADQLQSVAGTVFVDGKDIRKYGGRELAQKMALLMTARPGAEWMSVEDMVATGRYPYTGRFGILSTEDTEIVREAMRTVHIDSIAERDFNRISDGQKQLTLLARAICQQPEILVMDEPTSFLDIHRKLELFSVLKQLIRKKNMAVILSLHELDLAQKCADRLVCVANGKVDRCGTPEEIFTDTADSDGIAYSAASGGKEHPAASDEKEYPAASDEKGYPRGRNYIERLYGIEKGSFLTRFGSSELERITGTPRIFVIGGGGSGLDLYRRFQRAGIPFACGVLQENDVEYSIAEALASICISEKAFYPIGEKALQRAKEILKNCDTVYCTLREFGPMNEGNRELVLWAKELGIPVKEV